MSGAGFELVPVVEYDFIGHEFAWASPGRGDVWVVLNGDSGKEDALRIVAALAAYNTDCMSGTVEDAVAAILASESLVLPGGLQSRRGGVQIYPSCCCGLEGWKEWFEVAPGGPSPWLGHDPSPHVETGPEHAIVHADQDEKAATIEVYYAEMEQARQGARADLIAFVDRLEASIAGRSGAQLAARFREAFHIS